MKKVLFTLAVVLGMATAAQAQLVIGGGINFSGTSDALSWNGKWGANYPGGSTSQKYNIFGFGIQPLVAYDINDNIEVGAKLSFNYEQDVRYTPVANLDGKSASAYEKDFLSRDFSWYVAPYFRYRLFDVKGFGFWLQAEAQLGTSLENKTTFYAYGNDNTNQRTQTVADAMNKVPDGHKYSKFNGAGYVKPVLTYTIQDHWVIVSELDLLSLGVQGFVQKTTDKGVDRDGNAADITEKENYCNFNLGIFQGRAITLGVAYKF